MCTKPKPLSKFSIGERRVDIHLDRGGGFLAGADNVRVQSNLPTELDVRMAILEYFAQHNLKTLSGMVAGKVYDIVSAPARVLVRRQLSLRMP